MSSRIADRFRRIPWRTITAEACDRSLLVIKTVCVVHVINNYALSPALVRGPSMLPAFNLTGDVILMDRITPQWGKIRVGDVVFLRSPQNPTRIVAKRVTGVEGDSVTYLAEPGVGSRTKTVVALNTHSSSNSRWPALRLLCTGLVPKGHVWVQGDNIYASRDSREYGPVANGLIQGRAFLRVWPPKDFGYIPRSVAA